MIYDILGSVFVLVILGTVLFYSYKVLKSRSKNKGAAHTNRPNDEKLR